MEGLAALAVIAILAVIAGMVVVSKVIYICGPNEVLIFSGTQRRRADGRTVGYKLVRGGRKLRIPLLEEVDKLDLTNMIIELKVQGAYSKGGIPLNVDGVANIKIASDEPLIGNAIERFLGKGREKIMQIAQETLEGNLRGVLATLTPEEVNQDRVKFAQSLLHEGEQDLQKLGLMLDTLRIQHVSDDKGYLNSIGRKQSAEIQRKSRIAEAENKALATIRDAENAETKAIARLNAEIGMARAEAERRIVEAQTRKAALVAEEQSEVTAAVAKARAELDVQKARIEQVRFRLLADRIKPAEAKKSGMIAAARGAAARIVEEGRATAASLRELGRTFREAGPGAREILISQKLEALVAILTQSIGKLQVDRVTLVDPGLSGSDGAGLAAKAAVTAEGLKQMLGLDVPALLSRVRPAPPVQAPKPSS
jgi:flotillin